MNLVWLRGHVVRYSNGPEHVRRRALIENVLAEVAAHRCPGEQVGSRSTSEAAGTMGG